MKKVIVLTIRITEDDLKLIEEYSKKHCRIGKSESVRRLIRGEK